MHVLKRFFMADLVTTSVVASILFCLVLGMWLTVRSPKPLEQALATTNAYAELVPDVLAQHTTTKVGDVPLSDTRGREIISQAFPAHTTKTTITSVLDGTYAWLQGKTAQPAFRVDLTPERDQAVQGIAAYVSARYNALPACSPAQSAAVTADLNSPYLLNCKPAWLSASEVEARVRQSLLGGSGFLKTPILDAATLKDKNNQPLLTRSNQPRRAYANVRRIIIGIAIIGLLALGGIILLHQDGRWQGGRRAAIIVLVAGMVSLFLAWVLNRLMHMAVSKASQDAAHNHQPIDQLVTRIMQQLAGNTFEHLALLGGALALAGAGGLALCLWRLRQNTTSGEQTTVTDQKNRNASE